MDTKTDKLIEATKIESKTNIINGELKQKKDTVTLPKKKLTLVY